MIVLLLLTFFLFFSAEQLYYLARDMLDLFRAVVPVVHATELGSVPLIGMCFFNDCVYIAYHLVTLAFQFKSSLPEPLKTTATFVDQVPLFRRVGEKQYKAVMVRLGE